MKPYYIEIYTKLNEYLSNQIKLSELESWIVREIPTGIKTNISSRVL